MRAVFVFGSMESGKKFRIQKLITYILVSETGSSLKAAGWKCAGECGGKRWNGRSAPKVDLYPAQMKLRFEVEKGGE